MRAETDVLVVGAGPVGLFLALALTRRGVTVRVVDKAAPRRGEPRAAVLWPRAQALLAELGALEPFAAHGAPIRRTTVWAGRRRLGTLRFGRSSRGPCRFPLAIEQHDTERLLRELLADAGVAVEHGREAIALRPGRDRVEVDLRGPDGSVETTAAAYLAGCDGAHSFVREALGVRFVGRPRPNLQVLQVDASPVWDGPGEADGGDILLARGVSVSLYPMPDGRRRIFAFARDRFEGDPAPGSTALPTLDDMEALLTAVSGRRTRLEADDEPWLNRARFQDRTAERFRSGRVLLCGDAAHVWAPVGGHGMNVGLYGADNLARGLTAVLRQGAPETALDRYAREQRRLATRTRIATRFDLLEQPPNALSLPLIRTLLPAALSWPAFHGAVDRMLGDLRLSERFTGRPPLLDGRA